MKTMVQKVNLELVLLFLTILYPKRITPQRFYDRPLRPAYYSSSSDESFEMSSESFEGGYRGWRPMTHRLFYERFAEYAIVNENHIRPSPRFGARSLFGAGEHFFGTFTGTKYFIIQDFPSYNSRPISMDGVLVSENRLKKLYESGKAPQRLPLVYVGRRQYEDVFLVDKSYLDALQVGSRDLKTIGRTPTGTVARTVPSRSATVPSREGGIPGRNLAQSSRSFRG